MTTVATFTVSLSAPAPAITKVDYATVSDTAASPADFSPASGTLTFAIGEQSKDVTITYSALTTANVDKRFKLALANPVGVVLSASNVGICVLSTYTAVSGVIVHIANATIAAAPTVTLNPLSAGTGIFANQMVDTVTNNPVRLKSINWYGLDSPGKLPHGIYVGRSYKEMMDQIKSLGFNCIRLPFCDDFITSSQTFDNTGGTGDIFYVGSGNPDLVGQTPLQALDCIVYYASTIGMRIVLDHHRLNAISIGTVSDGSQGPIYGTDGWPAVDGSTVTRNYYYGESTTLRPYGLPQWTSMWTSLATHFTTNHTISTVSGAGQYATNASLRAAIVGFDPHNEPHFAQWSVWADMVEALVPSVHAIAPDWMVFIEGVADGTGLAGLGATDTYWHGGYLKGVATRPINLGAKQNKVCYSPHEYAHSVYNQAWLSSAASNVGSPYPIMTTKTVANYPNNLEAIQEAAYGYIFSQGIAPLWLGEFGGGFGYDYLDGSIDPNQTPNAGFEIQWIGKLVQYMNGTRNSGSSILTGGQLGISFAYFALNPESGNPLGGLLMNKDYSSVQTDKVNLLLPLFS